MKVHHKDEPDFTKPLLKISAEAKERILSRLGFLYGEDEAQKWLPELKRILKVYCAHKDPAFEDSESNFNPANRFTENDIILITYGDLLRSEGKSPLATLAYFMEEAEQLKGIINTLHILPFFPYTSDRGFSVTDFRVVDPHLGSWKDVEEIGKRFKLMFDGVLNHASSKSHQIQEMLQGNPEYKDFAVAFKSPDELTPEQRSPSITCWSVTNNDWWMWVPAQNTVFWRKTAKREAEL